MVSGALWWPLTCFTTVQQKMLELEGWLEWLVFEVIQRRVRPQDLETVAKGQVTDRD